MRTKQAERALLLEWQRIAREEKGSYLAQFLTDDLVADVLNTIDLDQSPDIFAALKAADDKVVAANERYTQALHEIADLRETLEKVIENMRDAERMVTRRDETIRELKNHQIRLETKCDSWVRRYKDAMRREQEVIDQVCELEAQVDQLYGELGIGRKAIPQEVTAPNLATVRKSGLL